MAFLPSNECFELVWWENTIEITGDFTATVAVNALAYEDAAVSQSGNFRCETAAGALLLSSCP